MRGGGNTKEKRTLLSMSLLSAMPENFFPKILPIRSNRNIGADTEKVFRKGTFQNPESNGLLSLLSLAEGNCFLIFALFRFFFFGGGGAVSEFPRGSAPA